MKTKIFLTSFLAITFAMPTMAEITSGATCDTTNLGQSENNSTANVEADWTANTININWYNGENIISTNTCTYDGTITLPTEPTKTGYTFTGWALRNTVNCSGLNTKLNCNSNSACVWYDNICLDINQARSNCNNADLDICDSLPTCRHIDPENPRKDECVPWNPPRYCNLIDNMNDCEKHAWLCEWNSSTSTCQMASECNQYINTNDCTAAANCTWNSETTRCIYVDKNLGPAGDIVEA